MSTNKPTPGPWEYLWHEAWHDRSAYAEVGVNLDRGGIDDKIPIAHVWHEPDARLIAASPLMFQALEQVAQWFKSIEGFNEWINTREIQMTVLGALYEAGYTGKGLGAMSTLPLAPTPPPIALDASGVYRVGSTRVTLRTVIGAYRDGDSPEFIQACYPSLPLADIYATIAYYLQHQEAADACLVEQETKAQAVKERIEASQDSEGIRARLEARRTTSEGET